MAVVRIRDVTLVWPGDSRDRIRANSLNTLACCPLGHKPADEPTPMTAARTNLSAPPPRAPTCRARPPDLPVCLLPNHQAMSLLRFSLACLERAASNSHSPRRRTLLSPRLLHLPCLLGDNLFRPHYQVRRQRRTRRTYQRRRRLIRFRRSKASRLFRRRWRLPVDGAR